MEINVTFKEMNINPILKRYKERKKKLYNNTVFGLY